MQCLQVFIFFAVFSISPILVFGTRNGLQDCDSEMCNTACEEVKLSGRCNGGKCECYLDVNCTACQLACEALKLDGGCDTEGNCQCEISVEICEPLECEESCWSDPRAAGCLWVQPIWCMDYGPFEFCGCECFTWKGKGSKKRRGQTRRYKVQKHINDV